MKQHYCLTLNLFMMKDSQRIINHLNEKDTYGISVADTTTGLRLKKSHTTKNKFVFTKLDILEESESIEDWLEALSKKGFFPTAKIDLMYPNGSSSISRKVVYLYFDDNELEEEEEDDNNIERYDVFMPEEKPKTQETLPNPDMVALSIMEVLDLKHKESRLEDVLELKEELKEKIKKLRHQKRQLQEQNTSLRAKLKIADKVREIAIKQQAMEQKSMWDNPAIAKSLESLAGSLPTLLTKGQNTPSIGSPDAGLSENKQLFMEAMKDERVTDDMILSLHQVFKRLVQNKDFAGKLHVFLQQQHPGKNEYRHRRKKRNQNQHKSQTKK